MSEKSVLERNLLALSLHNGGLARMLSHQIDGPEMAVSFIPARTGQLVPVVGTGASALPLHSTFNPEREALRMLELYPEKGFLVIYGIGAGYHIAPFLRREQTNEILVIDRSLSMFRKMLENIDFHHIFSDSRVTVLVDKTPEEITEYVVSHYLPALYGDLATVPLIPRITTEKEYFHNVAAAVENTMNTISFDYTVQSRFGTQWFRNALCNLEQAVSSTTTLEPKKRVIVTGAGPSLEMEMETIVSMRSNRFLIATDTSLPALCENNIMPDCVISIDCQHISYHHFIRGYPDNVPIVLDLASPPILSRLADRVIYFLSGHPFMQYVSSHLRRFPFLDTSGGNVSHAAVSLALSLGCRELSLFGMDFSYPRGKLYSRGTYLYTHFAGKQNRSLPVESLFASMIFRNNVVNTDHSGSALRYTTGPLIMYRERLQALLAGTRARVNHFCGEGMAMDLSPPDQVAGAAGNEEKIAKLFSAGPAASGVDEFLEDYRRAVVALPAPENPVANYLMGLSMNERVLWMTQYPAMAALRSRTGGMAVDAAELLSGVRNWTLENIERSLTRAGEK